MKQLIKCYYCKDDARYHALTMYGSWEFMCAMHWRMYAKYQVLGRGMGTRI